MNDDWRVHVNDADVRAAIAAWEQAKVAEECAARLTRLCTDVERLCRAQAWQTLELLELAPA